MKPTVHDIASEAGVSLATVDRVLNGRPGVRAPTRERVLKAIEKLGFVRDVAAANLAKGRVYPLTFIVPSNDNSFMAALRAEIAAQQARGPLERTAISVTTVPAFDVEALVAALDRVRLEKTAGLAVVAIDAAPVRDALARVVADGIPVVTLVSDLPESERHHFAGIDNEAAGRTAGSLMGRFLDGRRGTIGLVVGSLEVRDHRQRLEGFRAALQEFQTDLTLLSPVEGRDEPERVHALVTQMLRDEPELQGIYSLGAGNRGLIRALSEQARKQPLRVIAHELTTHTRGALEVGLIDIVLNQDAGHEVRSAIRVLKAQADGQAVIAAQERIRIDIFLKDNLP